MTALRADLLDRDPAVTEALRGADAVFHLAGRPGVRDTGAGRGRRPDQRTTSHATAAVLAAVPPGTAAGRHLVLVGVRRRRRPAVAGRPTRCARSAAYARSKAAVERLCGPARPVAAVLRPFTVAGEGQRPDMALARWIAAVRAGRPIRILGSPARTRDVTDVRDVVRAARLAAERGVGGPAQRRHRAAAHAGRAGRRGVPGAGGAGRAGGAAGRRGGAGRDLGRHDPAAPTLGFVPVTDLDDAGRPPGRPPTGRRADPRLPARAPTGWKTGAGGPSSRSRTSRPQPVPA